MGTGRTSTQLPQGIVLFRGRYRVRMNHDGKTHSLGVYDTLTDAKAALSIARSEAARGVFIPPAERRASGRVEAERQAAESMTLREWSEQWLAALAANPDRSGGTIVAYRSVLKNHILPQLGDVRLVDLTPATVAEHLATLARLPSKRHIGSRRNGIAPNTAIVLRSCINAAVAAGAGGLTAFQFPPAPKHRRFRPEDEQGDVATAEEVKALTEAMPDHLRIAVPLAAWCALRMGEVLGLQRRDLEHLDDPERATLHVRRQWNSQAGALTPPKADSTRSIAIPAALLPALSSHLVAFTGPRATDHVVCGPTGRRVSQSTLDRHWREARDHAGRPGFHFHNLRHTGLSAYAVQGATLAELLYRGGHTDVTVALRYQHATAARDRALTHQLSQHISSRAG